MARLINGIHFIGSIGNLTGYKRKGSAKVYLRTKGGIAAERIKTAPEFEMTRQNNDEFSACSKAGAALRLALAPLLNMRGPGFNVNNKAFSLANAIQRLDTNSPRGKRDIVFSQHRYLLNGFSLNPAQRLESMLRASIKVTINRTIATAVVELPALKPGLTLLAPLQANMYRMTAHISVLADLCYGDTGYVTSSMLQLPGAVTRYTSWRFSNQSADPEQLVLPLDNPELLQDDHTIIVSLGLEFGVASAMDKVAPLAQKGTAQVVQVG